MDRLMVHPPPYYTIAVEHTVWQTPVFLRTRVTILHVCHFVFCTGHGLSLHCAEAMNRLLPAAVLPLHLQRTCSKLASTASP
jgi:hypothetical protein